MNLLNINISFSYWKLIILGCIALFFLALIIWIICSYYTYKWFKMNIDKDYFYEKAIPLLKYRGYEMDVVNKLNSFSDASFCSKTYKGYKKIDKEWDTKAWSVYQSNTKKRKLKTEWGSYVLPLSCTPGG